jgi:IS30 family transposase
MACYTMRTYEERTVIQKMWNDGAQAKEIADKLEAPLSTIYSELRRGQDGSRLQNQRLRYSADLAQLRVQQSFERRGRRSGKREGEKRA